MAFEIVVIGTSRGGLKALEVLLAGFDETFPLPVVIVKHRSKDIETGLEQSLGRHTPLPVSEPEDKETILNSHVYLAPADYHLLIEDRAFALSTEAPVGFARPSIDLLFESAANQYQDRAVGVILTGLNRDGASGLAAIKSAGGLTVVQDPVCAESKEMPAAAIAMTDVDLVLPLEAISPRLRELVAVPELRYGR